MIRFRLFGITVHVQPFFWLIMAFLGWGPQSSTLTTTENLVHTLVFMAAGFLSILVHEYGHALLMKRYGRTPQIILHGLGGVAISAGLPLTRPQNLAVTFAGPLFQIVLGGISLAIITIVGEFPTTQSAKFFYDLMRVSFFWALINLIPIHPLDGGQIVSTLAGPKHQKFVHILGIIICIGLIGFLFTIGGGIFGLIILGMLLYDNIKKLRSPNQP